MILGVPLGILTGLWVTWNGAKLIGGGWWTAGICLWALVLAATGGGILLRNRMPARIALGLTLLDLAIGLLRGVASERNTENEALVQVLPDITTVRGSVISDPVPRGTTQDVPVHVDAVVTKDGRWLSVESYGSWHPCQQDGRKETGSKHRGLDVVSGVVPQSSTPGQLSRSTGRHQVWLSPGQRARGDNR